MSNDDFGLRVPKDAELLPVLPASPLRAALCSSLVQLCAPIGVEILRCYARLGTPSHVSYLYHILLYY